MSKPIKEWLSEESVEASRKSKMWASGKRVDAISKHELNDLQWWRLEMIDLLNFLRPNSVSGKILEIGAGQGIASAYLTSFKSVDNVLGKFKKRVMNMIFIYLTSYFRVVLIIIFYNIVLCLLSKVIFTLFPSFFWGH